MIFEASGANLYYEKYGDGKPLILLHGNGETHEIFKEAIPRLSKYFTVYVIDSRGHGKSSEVSEFHYTDMARDICEFISGLHLEAPFVYGFSDGGIVALLMGIRCPELLSGIIASGVNANPRGIKASWLFLFRLYYVFTKSPLFRLMLTEPNITGEMLADISIPVSVIGGSKDVIKTKHMKWISDNVSAGRFRILNGETHSSYVVHNEKLADIIIEEVERQSRRE